MPHVHAVGVSLATRGPVPSRVPSGASPWRPLAEAPVQEEHAHLSTAHLEEGAPAQRMMARLLVDTPREPVDLRSELDGRRAAT